MEKMEIRSRGFPLSHSPTTAGKKLTPDNSLATKPGHLDVLQTAGESAADHAERMDFVNEGPFSGPFGLWTPGPGFVYLGATIVTIAWASEASRLVSTVMRAASILWRVIRYCFTFSARLRASFSAAEPDLPSA